MQRDYKKMLIYLYRAFSFIGFSGALSLSLNQFNTGDACPILFNILPACYLITFIFGFIFIESFFSKNKFMNTLILSFGVLFAGFATLSNLFGIASCPLTSSNIPMCYIAFCLFITLIVLNFLTNKK